MTVLKARTLSDTGVKYYNRTCRRTFGQMNVYLGVPIVLISKLMRHSSSKTWGSIIVIRPPNLLSLTTDGVEKGIDIEEVARCEKVKNPLIDDKKWIAGYA